jgi:hypothetical protein
MIHKKLAHLSAHPESLYLKSPHVIYAISEHPSLVLQRLAINSKKTFITLSQYEASK